MECECVLIRVRVSMCVSLCVLQGCVGLLCCLLLVGLFMRDGEAGG